MTLANGSNLKFDVNVVKEGDLICLRDPPVLVKRHSRKHWFLVIQTNPTSSQYQGSTGVTLRALNELGRIVAFTLYPFEVCRGDLHLRRAQ